MGAKIFYKQVANMAQNFSFTLFQEAGNYEYSTFHI